MTRKSASQRIVALMEEITEAGPELPEYDGMRVFDHRERIVFQLSGQSERVAPVTLDLWPALTCNARCPLCQYRVSGARDEVDRTNKLEIMTPALAEEIFAGAAQCGVRSVILTGGGEPTLNPNLGEIARIASRHGLRWGLNTNAFEASDALFKTLLNAGPAYIKLSIDAGSAESHSAIYNVPKHHYKHVIDNAIMAARTSAGVGNRRIGLSFTLAAKTSDRELDLIRDAIDHIQLESNGALSFAVFRARLLHYRADTPLVPQPSAERFPLLADSIRERVGIPLVERWGQSLKIDIKKGLFVLAARTALPPICLSNSWMTTITHEGEGYATGELAGAKHSGQCWGKLAHTSDFRRYWHGPKRIELHADIERGKILLPIVHRTSPVDEFLHRINAVVCHPLSEQEACDVHEAVSSTSWYRSRNSDFV